MSRAYKFRDDTLPYFISFACVDWIDLFTRKTYCRLIIDSLKYCQKHKDLILYAWVIMPNHIHLIIGTTGKPLNEIVRDFKSFTSRELKKAIKTNPKESRKEWLLKAFTHAGKKNNNNKNWQLWQQHNHPIELWDNYMMEQKLNYLHNNPVKAGYVNEASWWRYSSAISYEGRLGLLEVEFLE